MTDLCEIGGRELPAALFPAAQSAVPRIRRDVRVGIRGPGGDAHVNELFPHLGLERSLVLSASPYVQHETRRNRKCQIDLLIQTARMLMVVEIKRQREIPHGVIDEVREKVKRLRYDAGKSVRTALVYVGDLSPSVPADHYFDFIVPVEKLLGS